MSFFQKIVGIILLVLIVLLSFSIVRNYSKLGQAGSVIDEARNEVQKLEDEQKSLEKQIAEAESQEFIEKQLRDKLGLAKEGEVVIVLPEENELKKLAPAKQQKEEYRETENWRKWQKLFF